MPSYVCHPVIRSHLSCLHLTGGQVHTFTHFRDGSLLELLMCLHLCQICSPSESCNSNKVHCKKRPLILLDIIKKDAPFKQNLPENHRVFLVVFSIKVIQ